MTQTSTEKLVAALEELKNPDLNSMIKRVKAEYYNEYFSQEMFPIIKLVQDLDKHGLKDLSLRARNGEFDATDEEAYTWAASSEGQEIIKTLTGQQP